MKFRRLYIWFVLFSLLVLSCEGNKISHSSVPPPPSTEKQDGGDGGDEGGSSTGSNPWDANRGKVVRPSAGNGWTVTPIEDGVVYYAFDGKESVSKRQQRIFVTDVDLSKGYSLKLAYYSTRNIASRVFTSTGAVAVINGGYEMPSIWVQINGSNYAHIANDYIGGTSNPEIPQWKSEAAIYLDQDQDVRIRFSGRGKNLSEWRYIYEQKTRTEKNFLTSSPMLISDYEPVGETFCDLHPKISSSSEDPYNHQSSTSNPRTAIATTHDNHVLLIVVDGRRTVSTGISALELTRFLVDNFNPQYALNLDGGGSSTMCVKGQGDSETHVVNYPCDNRTEDKTITIGNETITWPKEKNGPDHSGQRAVPTFFYVVKK